MKPTVLIIDDEEDISRHLKMLIQAQCGCNCQSFTSGDDAANFLATNNVAAVLLDWLMPARSGESVLKFITTNYPDVPVVIMTALESVDTAVFAMKLGASDFMTKPLNTTRLVATVKNALRLHELDKVCVQMKESLLTGEVKNSAFSQIHYRSEAIHHILQYIECIADSTQPVLISGESGTGKEGMAKAIHATSGVTGKFVSINIAGLDDHVFSDTLFGHKKGAFTGASESREGLIRQAEGGTLFLDEIGDLSEESQIKLLRLIQEGEYYRIGSDALFKSTARIVAATNREFDKSVKGTFRADLFYRLSTHTFSIPPLRDRPEDIPVLATVFVEESAKKLGKQAPKLNADVVRSLASYQYPGNVRELKNIIYDVVTRNKTGAITIKELPKIITEQSSTRPHERLSLQSHPLHGIFGHFPTLGELEDYAIAEVLRITNNNQTQTADILNMSRPTLCKRIKRW